MHVNGALVDRRVRAGGLGRAEQLARGDVDDREALRGGRAQRDLRRRVGAGAARHVAGARHAGAPAELAGALELLRGRLPARAEELGVGLRERALVRRAQQVLPVDQRRGVIEDRRLDRAVQELVGVAAEELVERVLAGQEHGQAAPPAPRPAPHLAQRGDGSGERDHQRAVQLADVDPELERVGRDDRAQLAAHQPLLELAALLGGVAGAVGGDELGELGVLSREVVAHQPAQHLDALARLHEADHARALADQAGQQLGRLAERRAALAGCLDRSAAGSRSRSCAAARASRRGRSARSPRGP